MGSGSATNDNKLPFAVGQGQLTSICPAKAGVSRAGF